MNFTNRSSTFVTVIVPCRNESKYIRSFISDALTQSSESIEIELIISDGMSVDGTRDVLHEFSLADKRVRWIDNPRHIVSSGLNLAIMAASGDIIVRMDVHTRYAKDYVLQCVKALEKTNAMCVGGPWVAEGHTPAQRAIAAAFQSPIGSGGASSRHVDFSGWVDTVYLGAWRRSDLTRLGGFDEALVRNQDDELCLRIHRQGGQIWQSSGIRSAYVPRASLAAVYRQFSQYGYWKIPVIQKHKIPASPRHVAPFAFIALMVVLALDSPFWAPAAIGLVVLALLYLGALVVGTRHQRAALRGDDPRWLTLAAAATMHFGYAVGFGRAVWDFGVLRRSGSQAMSQLTR